MQHQLDNIYLNINNMFKVNCIFKFSNYLFMNNHTNQLGVLEILHVAWE